MDEMAKDGILDGLTGELDDYSASKMDMPTKGDVTITISTAKPEDKDDLGTPIASACPMCGYEKP